MEKKFYYLIPAFIIVFLILILIVFIPVNSCHKIINSSNAGIIQEKNLFDNNIKNNDFTYSLFSQEDTMYINILEILNKNNQKNIIIPAYIDGVVVNSINYKALTNPTFDKITILGNIKVDSTKVLIAKMGWAMDLSKYKELIGSKIETNNPNLIYELNYNDLSYGYDYIDNTTIEYIPANPSRVGYNFTGWYLDKDCSAPFDFLNTIIQNNKDDIYNPIILYAGWEAQYD